MSLVPLLFSNWWEDLDHPHRLVDQDFGLGLNPEQLLTPHILQRYLSPREMIGRLPVAYYRPWSELLRQHDGGTSTVNADKNKFQVALDVQQFAPEEISVKVVDKCVVVDAKHDEKHDDHGAISRHFIRKYLIPEQCDIEQVSSSLSSDGLLTITAPRKDIPKAEGEKVIKIEYTGKPAIRDMSDVSLKKKKGPKKEECTEDKCIKK